MLTKTQCVSAMRSALIEAEKARDQDEIPIGAVIVDEYGKILGKGYNRRELDQDATQHAELIAIRQACQTNHSWRLIHCTLFVTLEPCPMCAGAIINSRLDKVYYGAQDPKGGAFGSLLDLSEVAKLNHHPQIIRGFFEDESRQMLKSFFKAIRAGKLKKPVPRSSNLKPNKL